MLGDGFSRPGGPKAARAHAKYPPRLGAGYGGLLSVT